jgi:hypothetical protein
MREKAVKTALDSMTERSALTAIAFAVVYLADTIKELAQKKEN